MSTPPPGTIGPANEATLTKLLAHGAEEDWLDYKADLLLNDAAGGKASGHRQKLARHINALSVLGGYVVVGVDDKTSRPTGAPISSHSWYDTAEIYQRLHRYLDVSHVHANLIQHGGQHYGLVCVDPHPDGCVIFLKDGDYTDDSGKQQWEFRVGQVYARRSTRSVPGTQDDLCTAWSQVSKRRDADREAQALAREAASTPPPGLPPTDTHLLLAVAPAVPATQLLAGDQLRHAAEETSAASTARWFSAASVHWRENFSARPALTARGPAVDLVTGGGPPQASARLYPDGTGVVGLRVGRLEGGAVQAWSSVLTDILELFAVNGLDLLLSWAERAGARGELIAHASLRPAVTDDAEPVALVLTDDLHIDPAAPPPIGAIPDAGVVVESARRVGSAAATQGGSAAVVIAHQLVRDLLNGYGRWEPRLLREDGTIDTSMAPLEWRNVLPQEAAAQGVLWEGAACGHVGWLASERRTAGLGPRGPPLIMRRVRLMLHAPRRRRGRAGAGDRGARLLLGSEVGEHPARLRK